MLIRLNSVVRRLFHCFVTALAFGGCAQGVQTDSPRAAMSGSSGSHAGAGGARGAAGAAGKATAGVGMTASGRAGSASPVPKEPATGDPCTPGQIATCTCTSTHTAGLRICSFDPATGAQMGHLTDCQSCAAPKPDAGPGRGDVTLVDAGAKPGTGGSSSSGSSTGGRSETSSPSTGGRGGAVGAKGCNCSQICFPIGILPCCRIDGSCGCTWAPGAYCL
jgi:hypothetical protein